MGLIDLPALLFSSIDDVLALYVPVVLRLMLWGILGGWLTMLLYRRFSKQERIAQVKKQQKEQQKVMMDFEGEFDELLPLIRSTLGLGFRQLRLALGPALLASLPVLVIVVWVAGQFAYQSPAPADVIKFTALPEVDERYRWSPSQTRDASFSGWLVEWPEESQSALLAIDGEPVLTLPLEQNIAVIHKQQWWNFLVANPLGYLPENSTIEQITIGLPERQVLNFGPGWVRGWVFTFFLTFLLSSVAFKFVLRIE
jgi:uncharacterized membrane protein (DUF106 family)